MPEENDDIMWPMERSTVVFIVEHAKNQPSLDAARPFIDLLEKGFRGVNNVEVFGMIDGITLHFKDEYRQEMRRLAERMAPEDDSDFATYPSLRLLSKLVRDGKLPKDKLMPYRAAMEAGVLLPSMPSVKDFNERFGTDLSAGNYSTYINAVENPYENDHDVRRYRMLVRQFKNPQKDITEE